MPLKNIGKDAKKQRMKLELFEPKMRKKKQREREKRVNMYGLKTEDLRSKTEKKKRKENKNLQTSCVWGRKRQAITKPREYMYKCVYFRCIKKEEKIEKRSR